MIRAALRMAALAAVVIAPGVGAECLKGLDGEVFCGRGLCARDRGGTVYCSRFEDGGAARTRDGTVLCGRGRCARTFSGELYCSTVEGGDALKDSRGRVRCEGRCERASTEHCERNLAGSAD